MINKKYQKDTACCEVTFSLPLEAAPNAREVRVVGDFNHRNWEAGVLMKATKKAYRATVEIEPGQTVRIPVFTVQGKMGKYPRGQWLCAFSVRGRA